MVVVVDDGPVVVGVARYQPEALAFAVAEANRRETSLRIVHAVWLAASGHGDDDRAKKITGQSVLDTARKHVEQMSSTTAVECILSLRPPITTLMSEADGASCLVLGADGLSWFDKLLGGEVATWVARHAACAVFVVPETTVDQDPIGPVVAAVDVHSVSTGVIRTAFDAAALRYTDVQVLHAVPPDLSREAKADVWAALDRAIAEVAAEAPQVQFIAHVILGKADDALVEASRGASLLVLGRPRPLATAALLSRPIALHLLREARCPVLLAPVDVPGP